MTSGGLYNIRRIREALTAANADKREDGSFIFDGEPPCAFLGVVADDNEAIVTVDCYCLIGGAPKRLLDLLSGDPACRISVIY